MYKIHEIMRGCLVNFENFIRNYTIYESFCIMYADKNTSSFLGEISY